MLRMPKIVDYLKLLTDEEVKYFVIINIGKCFESMREKLCSKLGEEKNLREVAESFYTFLTTPDEVEKYVELIEKMPDARVCSIKI